MMKNGFLLKKLVWSSAAVLVTSGFASAFQATGEAQDQAEDAEKQRLKAKVKELKLLLKQKQKENRQNASEAKLLKPNLHKAIQGSAMAFSYNNLPEHEGLKISFKVHFVGPWDGTGFEQYGPDRFILKVDKKMHLLDSTFNNCHITFLSNVWQSFPDPHQHRQIGRKGRQNFLYHGGEGATAISSLGFAWNSSTSVDSSYTFSYTVKHDSKQLDLSFLTNWVEDNSVSTYWIENLKVRPITKLKKLSDEQEEQAWLSFLQSDGQQAHKAWAEVYAAHPDKLIERVKQLMNPSNERVEFLIKQLASGKTPTRALQQEVFVDPRDKDALNIIKRIRYMRELALSRNILSTNARPFWEKLETNGQTRAIRKTFNERYSNSIVLEQISLRISGYLRMINSKESRYLASQFDTEDPEFECSPIQPFEGTWKDQESDFGYTILTDGTATSSTDSSGTWEFIKDELVITWESGNKMSLVTAGKNRCSATLTRLKPSQITKATFNRLNVEDK